MSEVQYDVKQQISYAVSLLAERQEDGKSSVSHRAEVLIAKDFEGAGFLAMEMCKKAFPESEGWGMHSIALADLWIEMRPVAFSTRAADFYAKTERL